jgi:hypothetical protein
MYGDKKVTCMAWGCEIDDGWFDLLRACCALLQAESERSGLGMKLLQVKEKWGLLRNYAESLSEVAQHILRTTERQSADICEKCGSRTGVTTLPRPDWIKTLCTKCAAGERT